MLAACAEFKRYITNLFYDMRVREQRSKRAEENFKKAIIANGNSERVADEIWKLYACPLIEEKRRT